MQALHNLYLVTLLVALVTMIPSVVMSSPRPGALPWVVAELSGLLLAAADTLVRRWSAHTTRTAALTAYFLTIAVVLAGLTAVYPTFASVAFGALPLAFALLRWPAATAVGVLLTGMPYLIRAQILRWLFGADAPAGVDLQFGPVYLAVVGVALPVLTGLFTAWAIHAVQSQSRARQALVEQLSATRTELAAASRLAGQAEERRRLAHELHDTVAQGLSGVMLQLEAAEQQLSGPGEPQEARRLLARAREAARGCLSDTRNAVAALRPEALDGAKLVEALTAICARSADPPVELVVSGDPGGCRPEVQVVALRLVQEALANAGKHASAGRATVHVDYRGNELCLSVRDDGRGFDPAELPRPDGLTSGGFGLAIMRERVETVGGSLSVVSSPGSGTCVVATLPAKEHS
ncbi:sensor histidine kinase [Flindersiella endophytica]